MNLQLFKVFMSEDVLEPLNKVLMSGYVTQGKEVYKTQSPESHLCFLNSTLGWIAIHGYSYSPCQNVIHEE